MIGEGIAAHQYFNNVNYLILGLKTSVPRVPRAVAVPCNRDPMGARPDGLKDKG
jgi:hypothetical protein